MVMEFIAPEHYFARPYSRLAPAYDRALGISNFIGTRAAFEALMRRYGIQFRSAADVGCGTGLFACYLSQCWDVPVFGVDRSPEMLTVAKRNCAGSKVWLLLQDIRCLCLPCPVDLITANFDTVNHLMTGCDLKLAYSRIWENIKPEGHFIFDMITPCQTLAGGRTYTRHLSSGSCPVTHEIFWDPWKKMLSIFVSLRSPRSLVAIMEKHRERAYSPIAAGQWLRDVGFMLRGVHDAATLRPAVDCPPRVIIIAKKSLTYRRNGPGQNAVT
jgi:SAM-dependent methyltransferase